MSDTTTSPSTSRRPSGGNAQRAGARRIAAEELTGLALQERGLTALLARQVGEVPAGPARERVQRHLADSRRHQRTFDEAVGRLSSSRGPAELVAGVVRSGFAAFGSIGATAAQVVTLPFAALRAGGPYERTLEDAGVEGAALANKIVILTALRRALAEAGEEETLSDIEAVRADALSTWDALLEGASEAMAGLVDAKAAA